MIEYNKLTYNWKSTADFPFKIYVESNDGINVPQRKSKLYTTDEMHGAALKQSDMYSTIEKKYRLYVWNVSLPDLIPVFDWLNSRCDDWDDYAYTDSLNVLQPYDMPGRYYHVLKTTVSHAVEDEIGGYEFEVTFTCLPFSHPVHAKKDNIDFNYQFSESGGTIENNTSIPWYPQLTIVTRDTNDAMLTIGDQHVIIKAPNLSIRMNCIPGAQNVSDDWGLVNECMIGEFFKIPPGTHGVVFDSNIESVSIWGGRADIL